MRNTLLALTICTLPLPLFTMIAAEKNREWQSGQVVESKAADARIHTIAGPDKTYIVRGNAGDAEDLLAVGATVRFAVEGTALFVSSPDREYRLAVLGTTVKRSIAPAVAPPVAAAKPAQPPAPAAPAVPTAPGVPAPPPPAPLPREPQPAVRPATASPSEPAIDNDAVVKMVLGGLKEDTVVSVIQARRGQYVLTAEALLGLKAAGVPQRVIDAMSAKMKAQR